MIAELMKSKIRITKLINVSVTKRFSSMPQFKQWMEPHNKVYPEIKKNILQFVDNKAKKITEELLDHILPYGRQTRPILFFKTYETLAPNEKRSSKDMMDLYYLAWCIDIMQAACVFVDDFIDGEKIRRGKPCYYIGKERFAPVHYGALLTASQLLLSHRFRHEPFYPSMSHILNFNCFDVNPAQYIEMTFAEEKLAFVDIKGYMIYKARYTTTLPFKFAVYMVDPLYEFDEEMDKLLEDMGFYMQAMNDGINVLNNHANTGKITSRLEHAIKHNEMNITLMLVYENGTDEDRDIISKYYGNGEHLDEVLAVFSKFDLVNDHLKEMKKIRESLMSRIEALPNDRKFRDALTTCVDILDLYHEAKTANEKN